MTKYFLSVVTLLLFFTVGNAQNNWNGSTVSTQTNGKVAIGTSISNSYKLRLYSNNASDVSYNFYNYFRSARNGTNRGIYNYNYYTGTGSKYGLYNYTGNSSTGNTYGIYTTVSSSGAGRKYALYARASGSNLENRAAYFEGHTEVEGNFIIGGNNGKFVFTNAWFGSDDFISIAPNTSGTNNTWDWDRSLKFDNSGELVKVIDAANKPAFSVVLNSGGDTNFQVMGDGRVFAREVEVTLDPFPDYVFADDYDLFPLGELENYIAKHHHLPNIPPAAEVKEEGMGLGELSVLQMEKIEELTLYILQLNERMEQMDKKLQALENENLSLKSKQSKK